MPKRAPTADFSPGYERAAETYRQGVLLPTGELLDPMLQRAYQRCVNQALDFWRPVVASNIDQAKPLVLGVVRGATRAWASGCSELGPPRSATEHCITLARDTFINEGVLSVDLLTDSVDDPDIGRAIEESFVQHAQFVMATIGSDPGHRDEVNGIFGGIGILAEEAMLNLEAELGPRPGPGWKPVGKKQLPRTPRHEGALRYWVKRLTDGGSGLVWCGGVALGTAQSLQTGVEALI